jgi:hypothetical protein
MRASSCGELRPPLGMSSRMKRVRAPRCGTSFLLWVDTCPSGNSRELVQVIQLQVVHSNRHRHRHRFSRPTGARFCSDKRPQGFTSDPSTFRHIGIWGCFVAAILVWTCPPDARNALFVIAFLISLFFLFVTVISRPEDGLIKSTGGDEVVHHLLFQLDLDLQSVPWRQTLGKSAGRWRSGLEQALGSLITSVPSAAATES